MGEPLRRPVQRDPAEEEDGQDEVGEEGGEVNHLEDYSHLSFVLSFNFLMMSQSKGYHIPHL